MAEILKKYKMSDYISTSSDNIIIPIKEVTQVMNEKDLQQIHNEALVKYTKLEVEKLKQLVKKVNEDRDKIEKQTEILQTNNVEFDALIENSRNSIKLKQKVIQPLISQIENLNKEQIEWKKTYTKIYEEHQEQYENIKQMYITQLPVYKQCKQLELQVLNEEVKYEMLQHKKIKLIKHLKGHQKMEQQIHQAEIIKFAEVVKNYWKMRDMTNELKIKTKQESEIRKNMFQQELLSLSIKKNIRANAEKTSFNSLSEFKLPALAVMPPLHSQLTYTNRRFQTYDIEQNERMQQIRTRCDKRQKLWSKQFNLDSQINPKRHLRENTFIDTIRNEVPNPAKVSKINIIDVQVIPNKEESVFPSSSAVKDDTKIPVTIPKKTPLKCLENNYQNINQSQQLVQAAPVIQTTAPQRLSQNVPIFNPTEIKNNENVSSKFSSRYDNLSQQQQNLSQYSVITEGLLSQSHEVSMLRQSQNLDQSMFKEPHSINKTFLEDNDNSPNPTQLTAALLGQQCLTRNVQNVTAKAQPNINDNKITSPFFKIPMSKESNKAEKIDTIPMEVSENETSSINSFLYNSPLYNQEYMENELPESDNGSIIRWSPDSSSVPENNTFACNDIGQPEAMPFAFNFNQSGNNDPNEKPGFSSGNSNFFNLNLFR